MEKKVFTFIGNTGRAWCADAFLAMQIQLQKGDITKLRVDAIVNAANSSLMGGGGVDGAIHRAGGPDIMKECNAIRNSRGGCKPGEAVITTAGKLSARFVIHTVGPVWKGGIEDEENVLYRAYANSMELAQAHGLYSIAFPNISTGVYGFPKQRAAEIAVNAVKRFIAASVHPWQVIFICYDEENYKYYQRLLQINDGS